MNEPALFLPHNAQEFENEMRALIVKHMGLGQGNPTGWVVQAVCEAYQRGFGLGFKMGQSTPIQPAPRTAAPPLPLMIVERVDKADRALSRGGPDNISTYKRSPRKAP